MGIIRLVLRLWDGTNLYSNILFYPIKLMLYQN